MMVSYYLVPAVVACTQLFRLLDKVIAAEGYHKPYYAVHVIHNMAMVVLTVPDVWYAFTLENAMPMNWAAILMCYCLHFYHVIDYYRVFRFDDWLHHGLMIGIALPLGSLVRAGPLMGCNLFFTTGLPGAISYGLLFCNRNGMIESATAKYYNAATNLWIRAPGCVAQATLSVSYVLIATNLTTFEIVSALLIAAITVWNGLYFMEQALRAKWDAQANANNRDRDLEPRRVGAPAET